MQINGLGHSLKKFKLPEPPQHAPSLPSLKSTPTPERGKVASNPVRVPVNRQAARIISPVRCWAEQPLPERAAPVIDPKAFAKLQAELKTERNAHALTRDELGFRRKEVRMLREAFLKQGEEIDRLRDTVRQLEDLKL